MYLSIVSDINRLVLVLVSNIGIAKQTFVWVWVVGGSGLVGSVLVVAVIWLTDTELTLPLPSSDGSGALVE